MKIIQVKHIGNMILKQLENYLNYEIPCIVSRKECSTKNG